MVMFGVKGKVVVGQYLSDKIANILTSELFVSWNILAGYNVGLGMKLAVSFNKKSKNRSFK